jgi:hypothetical protein
LFPHLREEITELERMGAQLYVSRKTLSPLEQCILANLRQPLQPPGSAAMGILGENYFN